MADNNKFLKGVGIIAGILAGIWVVGSAITGKLNPRRWFAGNGSLPKDGEDCKTADDSAGYYENGNCIKNTGLPDDTNPVVRTTNGNNVAKQGNAPPTIIVPFNTPVPYSYAGCTYGKPVSRVQYQGQWMMQLTKVSCP